MATFRYKALNEDGLAVSGDLAADSRQNAIAALADQGVFVTDITPGGEQGTAPSGGPVWRLPWAGRVSRRSQAAIFLGRRQSRVAACKTT